jgi:hypothetical protein
MASLVIISWLLPLEQGPFNLAMSIIIGIPPELLK